ncbi:MAG: hypothetical protein ACLFTI_09245 [Anaerolineales bacterium]
MQAKFKDKRQNKSKGNLKRHRAAWIVLLLLAALLRLPAPDWDAGIAAHPDERFLLDVAHRAPLGGDPCAAVPDFPYGHLPVYAARLLILAAPDADPLYAARLLSGVIGVTLVALGGAWGRALAGERGGLLTGALLAGAPLLVQHARFYTVDPLGAAFVSGAILAAARRRWRMAGALAGLAVACKASLGWGIIVLLVGIVLTRREASLKIAGRVLLFAALAFALTSPWAVLRPVACWRGPLIQAGMVAGRYEVPYTQQYAGALPFFYPLWQMALWGLGPTATMVGAAGVVGGLARWRKMTSARRWAARYWAAIWAGGYFLATAGLYVKFPRYLLPIYPVWAALAALTAVKAGRHISKRWGRRLVWGALLAPTALLGVAQASLYGQTHPWMTASRWLYASSDAIETIAVERWDHPLPVPAPEGDPGQFEQMILPVFAASSPEKTAQLAEASARADVIILASRRGYGALTKQPAHYDFNTLAWYRAQMRAREVIAFGRCPRLGPLALSDDPLADSGLPVTISLAERCGTPYALRFPALDESFRVYDAPTTLLLLD